jgi:hypothetical protein
VIQANPNDDRVYAFVPCAESDSGIWPFEQCSSCDYPAPLHDYNADRVAGEEPEWICCLCANVRKSTHGQVFEIQRVILNVGNTILAALGAFGQPSVEEVTTQDLLSRWWRLLQGARVRNAHLTEEEINADMDAAIAEVRAARRAGTSPPAP